MFKKMSTATILLVIFFGLSLTSVPVQAQPIEDLTAFEFVDLETITRTDSNGITITYSRQALTSRQGLSQEFYSNNSNFGYYREPRLQEGPCTEVIELAVMNDQDIIDAANSGESVPGRFRDLQPSTEPQYTCVATTGTAVVVRNVEVIDDDIPGGVGGESGTVATTCEYLNPGFGWIFCGVMDWMVNFLGELTVTTEGGGFLGNILNFSLEGNQEDAIRAVWSSFRVLANSLFVIMFLFVIYSAATGSVINAYDLKRLLPRLIFSAIAVQLSFFISLTMLNFFNDLGVGAGQLMLAPLPGEDSAVTSILVASPLNGLDNIALPLVYLLLTIIVAGMAIIGVIMMAVLFIVRNMGLVILIAISPIAFVLWTLPNTEKIFRKWWEWFVQLLAVFPIAALFFASGKLIAYVWIGSTGGEDTDLGEGNIGNVLIGTIALFAPYFLAPKLMTFTGSAMGSIVRGVNGMKEGMDRARNSGISKRIQTNVGAKAASRLNRPDPGMMGKMMQKTSIGRRVMAEQVDRKKQQDEGDARAAQVLQRERTAGLSGTERRDANRAIVINERGNHTPAEQSAAMRQMIIDSDEEGFHEALTSGGIEPTTWSTFMDQHGKEVHEKFRHFSTGSYNSAGQFEPNYSAVAKGTENDLGTFKPDGIERSIHQLQSVVANNASSAEEKRDANDALTQLATTYLGARENPQIRANWTPDLRNEFERLTITTGVTPTPPTPTPPPPPPPPAPSGSSSGNTPTVNINMNTPMQGSGQQQSPPTGSGEGGRVQQEFGQPRTFRPSNAVENRPPTTPNTPDYLNEAPQPTEPPPPPPENNQQQ